MQKNDVIARLIGCEAREVFDGYCSHTGKHGLHYQEFGSSESVFLADSFDSFFKNFWHTDEDRNLEFIFSVALSLPEEITRKLRVKFIEESNKGVIGMIVFARNGGILHRYFKPGCEE